MYVHDQSEISLWNLKEFFHRFTFHAVYKKNQKRNIQTYLFYLNRLRSRFSSFVSELYYLTLKSTKLLTVKYLKCKNRLEYFMPKSKKSRQNLVAECTRALFNKSVTKVEKIECLLNKLTAFPMHFSEKCTCNYLNESLANKQTMQ